MFYQQWIGSLPRINLGHWSFAINGIVRHPLILSYTDLLEFPTQTIRCAISCAGKSPDRPLLDEAVWRGVPLQSLLDELTIALEAQFARIHAADGYTAILPLDRLANTYLVYEMDGEPLPPEHGYPARLIAPGLFGYKMPKWIERIELSDSSKGGFWESRGFSLEGDAMTKVAILSHNQNSDGSFTFSGIANAGSQPIRSVHISIDGADSMNIPFTQESPFALAHWQINWMPPGIGDYLVRASADGIKYADEHRIVVKVR